MLYAATQHGRVSWLMQWFKPQMFQTLLICLSVRFGSGENSRLPSRMGPDAVTPQTRDWTTRVI